MASENETVESVIQDMRAERYAVSGMPNLHVRDYASRIESAWRREKAELCECLKEAKRDLCKACKEIGFKCKRSEPCCTVMNIDIALHKALECAKALVAEGGES